jgi:Tfp pilus assembly protein FimT
MVKNKSFLMALALVAIMSLLAACSSSESGTEGNRMTVPKERKLS